MAFYTELNPDYGQDTRPLVLTDFDDINASIENILGTRPGENWWHPDLGSDLKRYLFDPVDAITAEDIYTDIILAVRAWEPRIAIQHDSDVTPAPDGRGFVVRLSYVYLPTGETGAFNGYLNGAAR